MIANAGGLLKGQTTWTSPDFTVPAGSPVRAAAIALDRRLDGTGAIKLDPESSYTVRLVDRTAGGTSTPLTTETIDDTDGTFARHAAAVPAGAVVEGHTYALSITTTTTTKTARVGVGGSSNTRYDNVSLALDDSAPPAGLAPIGDGAAATRGVTVGRAPISNSAITSLLATINPYAEVGKGPGGSLVPVAKCTIVGTKGNDRIRGTKGNDVICGLGGNDRIDGAGGRDVIDTANGNDIARGGTGADTLIGVRGKDRLSGQAAGDRLGGGASADRLNGGSGNDRMNGGTGNDRLAGTSGRDRLDGAKGADRVAGGSGADRINARDRRRDRIDGGSSRDRATVDRRRRTGRRGSSRRRADRVRHVERVR